MRHSERQPCSIATPSSEINAFQIIKIQSFEEKNTVFFLLAVHFHLDYCGIKSFLKQGGKVHYSMPFKYHGDKVISDIAREAYEELLITWH